VKTTRRANSQTVTGNHPNSSHLPSVAQPRPESFGETRSHVLCDGLTRQIRCEGERANKMRQRQTDLTNVCVRKAKCLFATDLHVTVSSAGRPAALGSAGSTPATLKPGDHKRKTRTHTIHQSFTMSPRKPAEAESGRNAILLACLVYVNDVLTTKRQTEI